MTLSAASALLYAPFRGESVIPYVGGKPTHARNAAGGYVDQNGIAQSAIVNTPRFNWGTLSGSTERRALLTLEQARTNLVIQSDAINTGWTLVTLAATNAYATRAGVSLSRLTGITSAATASRAVTLTGDAVKAVSILVRSDGVTGTGYFSLRDTTAVASRLICQYTIASDGSITAAIQSATGTLLGIVSLGEGVYRILCQSTSCTASHSHSVYAFDGQSSATLTGVQTAGVQVEDAPVPSAIISTTTATVTRSADSSFNWDFAPKPQAMTIYSRHIERGTIAALTNNRLWQIGKADNSSPALILLESGGVYQAYHHNGTTSVTQSLAAAPVYGDTEELILELAADGSIAIRQSINGGTVTSVGFSGALTLNSAWSDTKFWLNSAGTAGAYGLADYDVIKAVKYADVAGSTGTDRMAELRAYELGANGELLNAGS